MTGPDELHADTVLVAAQGHLSTAVEDERVVLDRDEGRYYGLNPVGARVFELLAEPTRFEELRKTVTMEFDVGPDRAEADLRAFLADLLDAGLVEVDDG